AQHLPPRRHDPPRIHLCQRRTAGRAGFAMSTPDYEVEYNNRARVPEHPALIEGWAEDAAAYRAQHAPRRIVYGPGNSPTIDLFESGEGPIVVFIHGGYWQALDSSFFSHCAHGLNAHGVTVAVPS